MVSFVHDATMGSASEEFERTAVSGHGKRFLPASTGVVGVGTFLDATKPVVLPDSECQVMMDKSYPVTEQL